MAMEISPDMRRKSAVTSQHLEELSTYMRDHKVEEYLAPGDASAPMFRAIAFLRPHVEAIHAGETTALDTGLIAELTDANNYAGLKQASYAVQEDGPEWYERLKSKGVDDEIIMRDIHKLRSHLTPAISLLSQFVAQVKHEAEAAGMMPQNHESGVWAINVQSKGAKDNVSDSGKTR